MWKNSPRTIGAKNLGFRFCAYSQFHKPVKRWSTVAAQGRLEMTTYQRMDWLRNEFMRQRKGVYSGGRP